MSMYYPQPEFIHTLYICGKSADIYKYGIFSWWEKGNILQALTPEVNKNCDNTIFIDGHIIHWYQQQNAVTFKRWLMCLV